MVVSPISPNLPLSLVQPTQALVAPDAIAPAATATTGAVNATPAAATTQTTGATSQQPSVQQQLLSALEQAFFTDMIGQFEQAGLFSADPALSATLASTFQLDALLGTGALSGGQSTAATNVQTLGADLAVLLSALAPQSTVGTQLNTFI